MRIALAQLNFTVGAFDDNYGKMAAAVTRARRLNADLVVFSELATTGYPPRDLVSHPSFVAASLAVRDRVAALSDESLGILLGCIEPNAAATGKPLFNAAVLCHDGRVVARHRKTLLPTYDVFDEDRYFEPGVGVAPLPFKGLRLGVTICEEAWNDPDFFARRLYPRDPVCELAEQGADILLNISSSPFTMGKADLRRDLIRNETEKNRRTFAYLNQVGGNDELVFDGHSLVLGPDGHMALRGRDFAEDFLVFDVAGGDGAAPIPVEGGLAGVSQSEIGEAWRALVLGLADYVTKCGFRSVVLGLSGGIDSALTATLAAEALGPACVTGIAMPTRYSSPHSLRDAEAVAGNLGIAYRVVPIDDVFQQYLDALAPAFAGRAPDTTEENIQARIRGAVLMAFSNKFGAMLLSTGNKSELAVGYCTLYGDMCGGLAVISDVPKTLVYQLARYANRDRVRIPEASLTKAPSAELRPHQTDQDSLPPYDILDRIVEAYVERHLDADAIAALGIDRATIVRTVALIDRNEYKRRQAAPGIKITSKAFGVGRRYPIAADYNGFKA